MFTKEDTGETFVHYIVVSPYTTSLDLAEHPEATGGGAQQPNAEGFPYSVPTTIKADARAFYGTEYREYKP